ncbi:GTP cyclohydrolase I [Streptosporangium sp. NPDC048865]|uniref:GTP cyclohydrolase I n=1 Tax=Streptosporangium sp. NPDC048865 TaxID=3155766 RepID=UPI00342F08B9
MTSPAAVARLTATSRLPIPASPATGNLNLADPPATPGLDDLLVGGQDSPDPAPVLSLHEHATALLEGLGIDTTETPTKGTGRRFLNALRELTYGLHVNPGRHLEQPIRHTPTDFPPTTGILAVAAIPIAGLCTCHALPTTGTADLAHLPKHGYAVHPPAQKLIAFTQEHAARPTNPEVLAHTLTAGLEHHLTAAGVAVRVTLTPLCLTLRNGRTAGARTTATRTTGALQHPDRQTELLAAWSTP